ncbi:MAG: hypothetical protein WCV84_02955 [Patescibacteria group bacterium]
MQKSWTFPLALGLWAVVVEASVAFLFFLHAPPGTQWLGSTIVNPQDTAIYLSYIEQGARGSLLFDNLFAIEPQQSQLLLFWLIPGLIARTGIPLILTHEGLRWIMTLFLAFAVYTIARPLTTTERDRRLACLLIFAGVGQGWLFSAVRSVLPITSTLEAVAPDMEFEFSVVPALLSGGAHIILSVALLAFGMHSAWQAMTRRTSRDAWIAFATLGFLLAFHPYFVPLVAIFLAGAALITQRQTSWHERLRVLAPLALAFVPCVLIFAPFVFDPLYKSTRVTANILPLRQPMTWIFTLFPFVVALAWRIKKRVGIKKEEYWLLLWIASAVLCLFLPFPWTKRFTQAGGIALVLLTLPAWLALRDRIQRYSAFHVIGLLLLTIAALSPLAFLQEEYQATLLQEDTPYFYASDDSILAWDQLRKDAPHCTVLADDPWIGVWTPAMTGCTTLFGHSIETPSYQTKRALAKQFFDTKNQDDSLRLLAQTSSTHILTTRKMTSEQTASLLRDTSWTEQRFSDDTRLFIRRK